MRSAQLGRARGGFTWGRDALNSRSLQRRRSAKTSIPGPPPERRSPWTRHGLGKEAKEGGSSKWERERKREHRVASAQPSGRVPDGWAGATGTTPSTLPLPEHGENKDMTPAPRKQQTSAPARPRGDGKRGGARASSRAAGPFFTGSMPAYRTGNHGRRRWKEERSKSWRWRGCVCRHPKFQPHRPSPARVTEICHATPHAAALCARDGSAARLGHSFVRASSCPTNSRASLAPVGQRHNRTSPMASDGLVVRAGRPVCS